MGLIGSVLFLFLLFAAGMYLWNRRRTGSAS